MEIVIGNQSFTKRQLRALYQAICTEEDNEICKIFAKMALEDGVDICSDLSLELPVAERIAGAFDASDVRQQGKNVIEYGLLSFVKEINSLIDTIPVELDVKVTVSSTASIG